MCKVRRGYAQRVLNGVDSIEHGSTLSETELAAFHKSGAVLVCTLSPALPMAKFQRETLGITEAVQYNSNLVYNNMILGARAALADGVPVGLGTDTGCPYTTHYNMWRELHYFQKEVGVTPEFALYTATLNNARILGLGDVTGSVEVGKWRRLAHRKQRPAGRLPCPGAAIYGGGSR